MNRREFLKGAAYLAAVGVAYAFDKSTEVNPREPRGIFVSEIGKAKELELDITPSVGGVIKNFDNIFSQFEQNGYGVGYTLEYGMRTVRFELINDSMPDVIRQYTLHKYEIENQANRELQFFPIPEKYYGKVRSGLRLTFSDDRFEDVGIPTFFDDTSGLDYKVSYDDLAKAFPVFSDPLKAEEKWPQISGVLVEDYNRFVMQGGKK